MPATVPDLVYIGLSALVALLLSVGLPVLAWLIRTGFRALLDKMGNMAKSLDELSTELRQEREDRIEHYGRLRADLESHKATCKERHRIAVGGRS
jgi:hypothetical protein